MDHLGYTDDDKDIADTGWWTEEDPTERRLLFCLHSRLHPRTSTRRYALIRTDRAAGRHWLMHLTKDQ